MRKLASLALGAGLAIAIPSLASADTLEGHFSGHAQHNGPAPGVYAPGVVYTAYLTLDANQINPWYPWDASKMYTAVIHATVSSYTGGFLQEVGFAPGASFRVFEDTTTPADYAVPATFTDGTMILSGASDNMLGTRVDIVGLPWDVTGTIVFTAGAGLGHLDGACVAGLSMNDFIDFQVAANPPGYQEAYNAEWKCSTSVSVDGASWGGVKSLYR